MRAARRRRRCRDGELLSFYTDLWGNEVLLPPASTLVRERAAGFAYHHADLLLPELLRAAADAAAAPPADALRSLLEPFAAAAAATGDPALVARLRWVGAHAGRQPQASALPAPCRPRGAAADGPLHCVILLRA